MKTKTVYEVIDRSTGDFIGSYVERGMAEYISSKRETYYVRETETEVK